MKYRITNTDIRVHCHYSPFVMGWLLGFSLSQATMFIDAWDWELGVHIGPLTLIFAVRGHETAERVYRRAQAGVMHGGAK